MIDPQLAEVINQVIVSTLGIDLDDVKPNAHFQLDFNVTEDDMRMIKDQLEQQLDIVLPDFNQESPQTVSDLYNLVDDSSL